MSLYKIICCLTFLVNGQAEYKTLTDVSHDLGSIPVLSYDETPQGFFNNFIRQSMPLVIRVNSSSWRSWMSRYTPESLNYLLRDTHGKAYQRPKWTSGWPIQEQLKFSEFTKFGPRRKLYWDSNLPLNSSLLKGLPLPYSIHCMKSKITSVNLLYTFHNSSSVFHQDGSENIFIQLSGSKTWLLANHSFSKQAYADDFDTQPGLSPINPQNVDIIKFPLASQLEFYKVTTQPGDLLFIPQYWWHHVSSFDPPNIGLNIWMDVFNFEGLENSFYVSDYVKQFAILRKTSPPISNFCTRNLKQIFKEKATSNQIPIGEQYSIYFGSDDGKLYALNSNGNMIWNYKTSKDVGSTPVLSNNSENVYFAGEDSFVYALDSNAGKLKWKFMLQDGVAGALRLNKDSSMLYIASLDSHVYALNSRGLELWKSKKFEGEIWASPAVIKLGLIICVMTDVSVTQKGNVARLNGNSGVVEWEYSADGPIFASPVVTKNDDVVFVISYDMYLHVINVKTGKLLWKLHIGERIDSSPVITPEEDIVYMTTVTGVIICIDVQLKQIIWSKHFFSAQSDVVSSPLYVSSTNVLYQAIDSYLYALNSSNGKTLWIYKAKGTFMSSPRMDKNSILYIGNSDKNLYALNGTDGSVAWVFKTNGPVVGSVVIPITKLESTSCGALL